MCRSRSSTWELPSVHLSGARGQAEGVTVPKSLQVAVSERRWASMPSDIAMRIFGEPPLRLRFFSLDDMHAHTKAFRAVDAGLHDAYGIAIDEDPHRLDPDRCLLVGETEPECPFALDYRSSAENPRVMWLSTGGSEWVEIAPSLDEFLRLVASG